MDAVEQMEEFLGDLATAREELRDTPAFPALDKTLTCLLGELWRATGISYPRTWLPEHVKVTDAGCPTLADGGRLCGA